MPAAQYVRMSTDHQRYSIANQSTAIAVYAAARGMVIVQSFVDAGKSGLHLKGRKALQDLIATVQLGKASFRYVLVYDVSRWGRFQDADEAAHYEYLCKQAGIEVIYCAEQFLHENATINNLLKALKRTMAGEYSRELSVKVFAAQSRIARMGFHLGGRAPFGLRRLLMDAEGKPKHVLAPGDQKCLMTDRVVLTRGPEEEVSIVRNIFHLFNKEKKTMSEIAEVLNRRGSVRPDGKQWAYTNVRDVLRNPKYTGNYFWARHTQSMGSKQRRVPEQRWVVKNGALPKIISPQEFVAAQSLLNAKPPRATEEQLLDHLRRVLKVYGGLSSKLVSQAAPGLSFFRYKRAFGSLRKAYQLIGFTPKRDLDAMAFRRSRMKMQRAHLVDLIGEQC
ncbi:MAG: recombinase family protein, partial [Candidatus Angelobacter sp.]